MAIMAGMASMASAAASIDMTYCASINTGSGDATTNKWMSDGLCYDTCTGSAFAIVQDSNCWCSDYVPDESTQTDTGDCNTSCPGYPDDTCGGDGLYGYMDLGQSPSGTKGASTSTTKATSTTQEVTTTVENGVTTTVLDTVTLVPTTSDESTTTTPTSQTTTAKTSTTTDSPTTDIPTTSLRTVTAGGTTQIQTVTVLPTATVGQGAESTTSAQPTAESGGIATGAAVGIAIGVIGFIGILGAIGVFFWLRRRRNEQEAMVERSNSGRGSSAGMMSTPRTEMASVWDSEQLSGNRRNSRIMPHDPRMDPFAANLYNRADNKSRESVNTIQDNHDYSRKVLRTTNPDPVDD